MQIMGEESNWNVNYDNDAVEALHAPARKKKKKTPVETASIETLDEAVEEVVGEPSGEPFGEQPDGEADGQPGTEAVGHPDG
ncbi:hypothetical protein HID58_018356 [Brassica napus]|uniref:Uncharacterized protein n=2 Tax=Brassica TaxID=3705 RepID=A0ABQ8D9Q5_BRANA|nr:hypothetical protein HID58_018356 [Brassica napus]